MNSPVKPLPVTRCQRLVSYNGGKIGEIEMQRQNVMHNGCYQHWIIVRPEPSGQFTAQAAGLPEIRATNASREEAIKCVRMTLANWLVTGQLVSVQVPLPNPLLHFGGHIDPNDPSEQEFLNEMERLRREDLEQTFREYDQECSDSSSTPIT
jgi:hypothetical protein